MQKRTRTQQLYSLTCLNYSRTKQKGLGIYTGYTSSPKYDYWISWISATRAAVSIVLKLCAAAEFNAENVWFKKCDNAQRIITKPIAFRIQSVLRPWDPFRKRPSCKMKGARQLVNELTCFYYSTLLAFVQMWSYLSMFALSITVLISALFATPRKCSTTSPFLL